MLYLVAVLASAIAFGRGPAILASGAAAPVTSPGRPGRWVRVVSPVSRDERAQRRLHSVAIDAGGAPAGSLVVLRRPGTNAFGAAEGRLLAATAAQIGLAVDRARLRDDATESEVLRFISSMIAVQASSSRIARDSMSSR